jgi:antitoxin (DNA-binding transcriptional repressor) of toxin-antitoxin stability system
MKTETIVGCFEVKNHASRIFARAEKGETFIVMRHKKPIAKISPVSTAKAPADAVEDIRKLRKGLRLRGNLKRDIEEGRL